MQEAFKVLTRAKREAQARLIQAESEGDKSRHKLPAIRHAIASIEEAERVLKWALDQKLELIRCWNLMERAEHVQVHSSQEQQRRPTGNRRSRRKA